jgi:hypothetical protein
MDEIEEFVDERLKSWCVHCGKYISGLETNLDHVPSKALLLKPHPPHLPQIEVCKACNEGFSLDEEYLFVFLTCVLAGSTDPKQMSNSRAQRALKRNTKLRARIEKSQTKYQTEGGENRSVWKPEQIRIDRIVIKNARGHAYYELGEPMLSKPAHVWTAPLELLTTEQRADFERIDYGGGWPELNSCLMTRLATGQDFVDGWVVVQNGVYRYAAIQQDLMLVRTVLFEYLATEVYWNCD